MAINRVDLNVQELRNAQVSELYSERNVRDHVKHVDTDTLKHMCAQDRFPFGVMTLNVLGDLNMSTVIRSAHLMGAERVAVYGRRKMDNRGLVGTGNYQQIDRVWGVNEDLTLQLDPFVSYCETHAYTPVFVEQGGSNVYDVDWKCMQFMCSHRNKKIMLVVGTEREGVPDHLIQAGVALGGHVVSIPQRGVIRSHNLSMAFAIVAGCMVKDLGWY
jgi:tRNA G18 (ribose-2'-O)-methylase SpoU